MRAKFKQSAPKKKEIPNILWLSQLTVLFDFARMFAPFDHDLKLAFIELFAFDTKSISTDSKSISMDLKVELDALEGGFHRFPWIQS